jgi:hypothetical protein
MDRACSMLGEKRNAYRNLVGKPEVIILLGRARYNIKMELREIEWAGMDWIDVAQDRDLALVTTIMNLRVPLNILKFSSS